jgi:hypothetical protein
MQPLGESRNNWCQTAASHYPDPWNLARDLCSRPCAHDCGGHQVRELCIGDMSRPPTRHTAGLIQDERIRVLVEDQAGKWFFWYILDQKIQSKLILLLKSRELELTLGISRGPNIQKWKSWSALDGLGLARWSQQDVGIFVKDNHGNNCARLKSCFQE